MAFYLLENGTDRYLMEDGSLYLMEAGATAPKFRRTFGDVARLGSRVVRVIVIGLLLWYC